jgi:hypothetical protein
MRRDDGHFSEPMKRGTRSLLDVDRAGRATDDLPSLGVESSDRRSKIRVGVLEGEVDGAAANKQVAHVPTVEDARRRFFARPPESIVPCQRDAGVVARDLVRSHAEPVEDLARRGVHADEFGLPAGCQTEHPEMSAASGEATRLRRDADQRSPRDRAIGVESDQHRRASPGILQGREPPPTLRELRTAEHRVVGELE